MREVAQRCPACGARTFRPVDLWSGTPDAELGDRLCASCAAAAAVSTVSIDSREDLQVLVFWAVVLVAVGVGVVEAINL